MRFALATYGTEGDTRPLAVLGRALLDAGHEVCLLAAAGTLGSADALGVPASAFEGDIREALQARATAAALAKVANANTESWMRQLRDAAQGCDAILVSGLAAFVGLSVAEYFRVPAIGLGLIPITPTRAFASPFLAPGRVPTFLNRASHELVNAMIWRAFRRATNAARAKVCALPPRRRVWRDHPMLYGISPALVPQPHDWPANARMCGQFRGPASSQPLDAALEMFLASGEPPLYVGFGSMAGFDRARFREALVEGVSGRRTVFFPGWSGLDAAALPANFHLVGHTPHDRLFPRVSMVVHHGGSGTTHSAARAGVPSVVVPQAGDQPFWAERVARLGIGSVVRGGARFTAEALARAIEIADRDESRVRAREVGEKMAREDGVASALAAIALLS